MDKKFNTPACLLPEFVFVVTATLTLYGAVCDKYEAHPILAVIAFGLSIYVWFAFQDKEAPILKMRNHAVVDD